MNLLVVTILLPLVGTALVTALAEASRSAIRTAALATTLVTAVLAGVIVFGYPQYAPTFSASWLGPDSAIDIRLALELDGLSLWLFGLSALLLVTSVLVSWEAIEERPALYYGLLLVLETGLLGVFAAQDIILFYVFFEFTLIPLFFLIGIWGSEERRYAANKFFLFTLVGSLFTFLGLLGLVLWDFQQQGSQRLVFSIPELTAALAQHPVDASWSLGSLHLDLGVCLFLALLAGFAIKVPLFPLHTWLPLAHVQAPTAGSVLLAGVLLKLGTYGFLRFSIPMLPEATALCAPWLLWFSVAGIVYGALVALAQSDIKRLIAYSSVSHLGFSMLGIFALNKLGTQGGALQMINHGLSTGGLFAIVGMLYERYHTRQIGDLGGLALRLPRLVTCLVLFTFASIGLPGLNGFVGEFLLLLGMFQRAVGEAPHAADHGYLSIAVLATSGVVLGAWYMLWLVLRIGFGPLREPGHERDHPPVRDLNARELAALVPLLVFIFWIGVAPQRFLSPLAETLDPLTAAATRMVDARLVDARMVDAPMVDAPAAELAATKRPPQGAERDSEPGFPLAASGSTSRRPPGAERAVSEVSLSSDASAGSARSWPIQSSLVKGSPRAE